MPDYHALSSHLAHYEQELARALAPQPPLVTPMPDPPRTVPDAAPGALRHRYFICFTNRSGSTLLAQALWHSGRMGRPAEVFNPEPIARAARERGIGTMRAYVDWLLAEAACRGSVFGAKLGMHQLAWLAAHGELARAFADARFVFVTRRDLLMQAVSLYIATQSGAWTSRIEPAAQVPFDAEAIARQMRALTQTRAEFEAFFASHGIEPLRLEYEEIEADLRRAMRRVCRHVGIEHPRAIPLPPVKLERQRTALNAEFASRYRALWRGGAGLPPPSD